MASSIPMSELVANLRQSFFDEGHLDDQFLEVERLQDEDEPTFVEDVVTQFLKDAAIIFAKVEEELDKPKPDIVMLDKSLHQFKGSSSSLGACKVLMECNQTREYLKERDFEKSKATFNKLKEDFDVLKSKFETYFQLMRQAVPVETAQRPEI